MSCAVCFLFFERLCREKEGEPAAGGDVVDEEAIALLDLGDDVDARVGGLAVLDDLELAHVATVAAVVDGDGTVGTLCRMFGGDVALEEAAALLGADGVAGLVDAGGEGLGEEVFLRGVAREEVGGEDDLVVLEAG